MKLLLYILLSASLLLRITLQQACPPLPLQRGCKVEKASDNGICVSKVFCVNGIDISWNTNIFYDSQTICNNLFHWNGHSFGDTIYSLKNLEGDRIIEFDYVTKLDFSCGEYLDIPKIKNMERLHSINISGNLLNEAKLYNSYELQQLTDIDFSHNTISNIIVDKSQHVYFKLKKINISHNYLVMIPEGIFETFTELENLDLSYNFIDYVSIETFEGIKNLIYLNLNHNRLSEINKSLFRFSKLRELYLSENRIQNVQNYDFEKLFNLKILDFSYNAIVKIDENTFKNTRLIQILNLRNNLLEVVKKETFSNMTTLIVIDMSNNRFKHLPKDLFKDKSIEKFIITENQLEGSLTKGIFEGLNLVTELDLSKQQLTSVEDFAFFGLDHLKELLLNDNSLRTLSKKSLNMLLNLETLDLSNNQLINIEFEKDSLVSLRSLQLKKNLLIQIKNEFFNGLNNLRFLDLSHNNISQLETSSFHTLKDLISFQIANNPISGALEQNTFNGLNSLPSLDISGTLLTMIKNGSFNGMNQLKELNASHCNISELQYNLFINTGIIETLDLSFNGLKIFEINTTELMSLEKLHLNNNLFTKISATFLKGLPRLTNIVISHNQLLAIDEKAFEDQSDLRHLDLSYNPNLKINVSQLAMAQNLFSVFLSGIRSNLTFSSIKEMSLSRLEMSHSDIFNLSFISLKNLKYLDSLVLSNNEIVSIDSDAFQGITKLRELDLSFNKIKFIKPGSFKENKLLQFLNVSHNALTEVNYGILTGLIYLETLDISYNELSDLKTERFYEVHSLTTLIADHNRISNVNSDDFSGTNLKKLSIGGNPIPCHILVNLDKADLNFDVTAIKLEDSSKDDNFRGVTCNVEKSFAQNKPGVDNLKNEILLSDIKHILLNISSIKLTDKVVSSVAANDSKYFISIVDKIDKMNSDLNSTLVKGNLLKSNSSLLLEKISSAFIEGTKNTTTLLERIVKVLVTSKKSDPVTIPILPKENFTVENLIPYINKIKQDFEDTLAVERQNIYDAIDKRISDKLIVTEPPILPSTSTARPFHEAYSSNENPNNESKSIVFLEVCVGLILVLMVGFILYNFYNSGMFIPNRHTASTRHLSDAMDNSAL